MDPQRVEALKAYRDVSDVLALRWTSAHRPIPYQKMQAHENMSEALKNCTSYSNHLPHRLVHMMLSTVFDQGLAKRLQEDRGGYQGRTVRRSDYWRGHEAARR
jgi:hypothetical protein